VEFLEEPRILDDIALNDPDPDVRLAAIARFCATWSALKTVVRATRRKSARQSGLGLGS
jgi:hypothetical protein